MLPVWLIEAGVYSNEAEPLLAEIRRQGMAADLASRLAVECSKGMTALGS
jgi:hypothetical protein